LRYLKVLQRCQQQPKNTWKTASFLLYHFHGVGGEPCEEKAAGKDSGSFEQREGTSLKKTEKWEWQCVSLENS